MKSNFNFLSRNEMRQIMAGTDMLSIGASDCVKSGGLCNSSRDSDNCPSCVCCKGLACKNITLGIGNCG